MGTNVEAILDSLQDVLAEIFVWVSRQVMFRGILTLARRGRCWYLVLQAWMCTLGLAGPLCTCTCHLVLQRKV